MHVTTFAAAQLLRFVPRVRLSRAVGRLCERELPPPVADIASRIYARAYGVNLGEAAPPEGSYRNFDAFFTRRLKDGARVIEDAAVVSPADGKIVAAGPVADASDIIVKGRRYDVAELTGDASDRGRYERGEFAVVYLHPRDYHRVHSPIRGQLAAVRVMPGDLFPVNAIGERHVPGLFVRNQRVAMAIESESLGRVTVVMVGATIVGRITVKALGDSPPKDGLHLLEPKLEVSCGDEIGTFHLGSTVVVLLERGAQLSHAVGPVLYGEALGRN